MTVTSNVYLGNLSLQLLQLVPSKNLPIPLKLEQNTGSTRNMRQSFGQANGGRPRSLDVAVCGGWAPFQVATWRMGSQLIVSGW